MATIDLTGRRFNRLVVLSILSVVNGMRMWRVQCDCGSVKAVGGVNLVAGRTQSCGCLAKERKSHRSRKHNDSPSNEHPGYPRLYSIWHNMKRRCSDPTNIGWALYGGRGITVCAEWLEYINFKEWSLRSGYREDLTIDRIDNDKGYNPGNCRWATSRQQNLNRRNTLFVTFRGERLPLKELCSMSGTNYYTVRSRLIRGWSEADALADIAIT